MIIGGKSILPVRLDDTEIAGLLDTIAYLDARKMSAEEICKATIEKIKGW